MSREFCNVKLTAEANIYHGGREFQVYTAGESFSVPANSSFKVAVKDCTDYCCSCAG